MVTVKLQDNTLRKLKMPKINLDKNPHKLLHRYYHQDKIHQKQSQI